MSLIGALNIGQSALSVNQAALQVTGNNIANASDPNYSVEVAGSNPSFDQEISAGIYIGTGVDLSNISRQVDEALNARLRGSVSDNSAASTSQQWTSQVENVFNALGTNSLSDQMSSFLANWSTLANNPTDSSQRALIVQNGQSLASAFNNLSGQLGQMQTQVQQQLDSQASNVTQLASQVASLNQQILQSGGKANSLDDQRDGVLTQLASLVNIQTVNQGNGQVNVYIGNDPLVMGTNSRGLSVQATTVNGQVQQQVVFSDNQQVAPVISGQISATIAAQTQLTQVSGQLNTQAAGLIFGLNSLQAQGQGTQGYTTVTGTNAVSDPTAALNSTAAGLKFPPTNGSFVLTVTDTTTGLSSSTLVPVSLTGQSTDTTLNSLSASLNAIPNVSASIQGGQLTIAASNPNDQITFSQDSSNVLASLGINTFFTGYSAATMGMNQTVANNSNFVAAAQNGDSGDGSNALAIANLANVSMASLGGQTLTGAYNSMIGGTASAAAQANTDVQSTGDVLTTLQSQQQSTSGVNIDQETVNMLQEQQAYQGAARLISTVDQMMQTLFAIT